MRAAWMGDLAGGRPVAPGCHWWLDTQAAVGEPGGWWSLQAGALLLLAEAPAFAVTGDSGSASCSPPASFSSLTVPSPLPLIRGAGVWEPHWAVDVAGGRPAVATAGQLLVASLWSDKYVGTAVLLQAQQYSSMELPGPPLAFSPVHS